MEFEKNKNNWEQMHPRALTTPTCGYYLSLMHKLRLGLAASAMKYDIDLPAEFYTQVAYTVAGYLEDLSSDFGIWATFRSLCREKYGKTMPFYDSEFRCADEDYDDESVNYDDVRFIVWMEMSICGSQKEMVYSPVSDVVKLFSDIIYNIIAEAWDENSPSSTRVADFIDRRLNSDDWVQVRELALWLAEGCYLTRIYNFVENIIAEIANMDGNNNDFLPPDIMFYLLHVNQSLTKLLRPLGITSLQFLAALARLKKYPMAAKRYEEARVTGLAVYNVLEYDGKIVTLKCMKRGVFSAPYIGEILKVDANSLKSRKGLKKGVGMMTSMVRWNGIYSVNGMASIFTEALDEEKENFDGGVPQQNIEQIEGLRKYSDGIIAKNKGSRFVFFNELDTLENITGHRADDVGIDFTDGAVLYVGDMGASEISIEAQEALKSKRNPFYNKKSAQDNGMSVLVGHAGLGYEAIRNAIDEGMLTDVTITARQGKRVGHKLVQNNIYFFADFYHSDFGVRIP